VAEAWAGLVAAMVGGLVLIAAVPFTARFFALAVTDPVHDVVAAAVGAAASWRCGRAPAPGLPAATTGRPPGGPR
jgi:hypothetical protein